MNDFIEDEEKINDLLILSKKEFLDSYSYLDEADYDNTVLRIKQYIKGRNKYNKEQKEKRNADIDKARKEQLDYYYNNRNKINDRRNKLGRIIRLANVDNIKSKEEKRIIIEYVKLHEDEIREWKKQRQEEKNKVQALTYYRSKKNG